MTANLYKPTDEIHMTKLPSVFFGGSIEMGKAENWQNKLFYEIKDLDIAVYSPRRDDWDSSWVQDISNENFRYQVEWELDHLDFSDIKLFYFDPSTKSPITLMELGLYIRYDPIVCCPDGFWRKGNIQIVCDRHNVKLCNTYEEMVIELKQRLELQIADIPELE